MKKIFIALSVLAALTLGVGSALAAPGVPDLVPGCDFTVPFLVSKTQVDDGVGPTTFLNLSEVRGMQTRFNIVFYSVKSVISGSDMIPITPWGTVMINLAKYIKDMSNDDKAVIEYTYEGEDYYAGYVVGANYVTAPLLNLFGYARGRYNNVIGSFYFLDLANGKAGASNLPMREYYNRAWLPGNQPPALNAEIPNPAADPENVNNTAAAWPFYFLTWAITQSSPNLVAGLYPDLAPAGLNVPAALYERWSAVALANAENMLANGIPLLKRYGAAAPAQFAARWTAPTAAWLAMYPEYYILDESGSTTFVIYQSGLANGSAFHMYVINAAEDYQNANIKINEVTFIDAEDAVPNGLKVKYPYHGIFNWTSTNPLTAINHDNILWAEFLGWSWQKAGTSAGTNWTIMKQIPREVGTQLVGPFAAAPEPFVDLSDLVDDILDLIAP